MWQRRAEDIGGVPGAQDRPSSIGCVFLRLCREAARESADGGHQAQTGPVGDQSRVVGENTADFLSVLVDYSLSSGHLRRPAGQRLVGLLAVSTTGA